MELLKMSVCAAAIIMVIAIIRALFIHKLPKRTFTILWGVAICRLLIPFSIPSHFSFYTLINWVKMRMEMPYNFLGVLDGTEIVTDPNILSQMPKSMATIGDTGISPVLVVWLVGMVFCGLFIIVTHLKCVKKYETALPIESDFITVWLGEHRLKRQIQIRQSDRILAPITYGIWHPIILLPKAMELSNEHQLSYVLTHELTHIKQFDILHKWVLAIALSVHWFNPFVWAMYVIANRDIELSCDETVVQTLGETVKSSYALTLIGLEEKKMNSSPLCSNFSKNSTEERIISIMKIKKTSTLSMAIALVVVVGTTAVFATSATSIEGVTPQITEAKMNQNFGSYLLSLVTKPQIKEVSEAFLIPNKDGAVLMQESKIDFGAIENEVKISGDGKEYSFDEFKKWTQALHIEADKLVKKGVLTQLDATHKVDFYHKKIAELERDGGMKMVKMIDQGEGVVPQKSTVLYSLDQLIFELPENALVDDFGNDASFTFAVHLKSH